jgi:lipoate-protein ligase B
MTSRPLAVLELGRVPYAEGLTLQRALRERRIAGQLDRDILLLLEHEPTVTLGRGTREASLPCPPDELRRLGLTVAEVERGGDVTWHGPGQLVGYPILDLGGHRRDLHWYLRQVEEALLQALAALGIPAERRPGYTGVWTKGKKIASIGVHVRQWVTAHGFAINVTNDLGDFDLIVPCGISGVEMTSVARELGDTLAAQRLDGSAEDLWRLTVDAVGTAFAGVFGLDPEPAKLDLLLAPGTDERTSAY